MFISLSDEINMIEIEGEVEYAKIEGKTLKIKVKNNIAFCPNTTTPYPPASTSTSVFDTYHYTTYIPDT